MVGRLIYPGIFISMLAAPAFAVTPAPDGDPEGPPVRLRLVDDAIDESEEAWRLDAEAFAPDDIQGDDLRWRVKVRPNRAMGRMSLSF